MFNGENVFEIFKGIQILSVNNDKNKYHSMCLSNDWKKWGFFESTSV